MENKLNSWRKNKDLSDEEREIFDREVSRILAKLYSITINRN